MYKIEEINEHNIGLLDQFIENKLPENFRYFNSRTSNVITNHVMTLLMLKHDIPFAYAHIDNENFKYWFGICVLDNYQGVGFGKQLIEYIINHNKVKLIDKIHLTVDKNNIIAKKLYEKYNFKIIQDFETYYLMVRYK